MSYLLWETASGCHGNCISCLDAPQAVASLAQSKVTSNIFCVGARAGWISLASRPTRLWTMNNIRESDQSNDAMSNWAVWMSLWRSVSKVAVPKRRPLTAVHVFGRKLRWWESTVAVCLDWKSGDLLGLQSLECSSCTRMCNILRNN